jgi:hypothetical protein
MSAAPVKDNKQVIVLCVFGALLLLFVAFAYNSFFGGSTNPAAVQTAAPAVGTVAPKSGDNAKVVSSANGAKQGVEGAAGVAATKMESTSSSLDPTLDESAMLRTENLVYAGSGRNIFSATYTQVAMPTNVPKARPGPVLPVAPPAPVGPPPPPPINLKYFGTALRTNGVRQAFLLNGEDVYLASAGDIVARKYKILSIDANSIRVEDLQNQNTQSLPLQVN